ncbi:ferrous iron transport protein B [Bacillus massiliigorillae]|uniref:ferrous iron transport protein B n=1 Tax=Bacillus massiliigorillae TaxID=1243664 RepID=UPI00039F1B4A|nr:ferrous iron transport protein B [Bacillus massiliigorillae]
MNRIALIGNPNTGKTSLFNKLTNSYEYVGNWSGVTVEKKVGQVKKLNKEIIDLPGIYDLNPISKDESVVTTFLLEEQVEGILNILDASNFERNMQLTVEVLELGKPVIICLNMMDVAKKKGITIDIDKLQSLLGVPVTPIVARTGKGFEGIYVALKGAVGHQQNFTLTYNESIEKGIANIESLLDGVEGHKRWIAIQFLCGNEAVDEYFHESSNFQQMKSIRSELEKEVGKSLNTAISDERSKYISRIQEQVMVQDQGERQWTENVDKILTHPILGIPIFLGLMYLMFQATFTWIGAPLSDLLDGFIGGTFTDAVNQGLTSIGASSFIIDLICDGIIAGVGGVLVFIPQIFVLFFFISLLEDSGYMARIAVVMDRLMEFFGLNGKAFIPMIISFGCNVPGVMAARTIEQPKERLLTILVAPFMSCSARLPVYALFGAVFFAENQSLVVFSLYILGIVIALIVTKILSMTILKKESTVFFVELPAYHVPQFKTLWRSTWEKGKGFLRKAGTIIFAGSVIIWLLSYLGPNGLNVEMDDSFLAMIGGGFGVLFAPLGFGTWQAGASLISGFLAKEVVVSTMAIIYGVSEGALSTTIGSHFTTLSAYTFMAFVLLYMPCLATVGAIKRETQSVKWTLFATLYPFVVAYIVALIIYYAGSLLI